MDTFLPLARPTVNRRIFPGPRLSEDSSEITISALADYWNYFFSRMGTDIYHCDKCGSGHARRFGDVGATSAFNEPRTDCKIYFDCIRL